MAQREIVLDTETTGLSYQSGDRIVDIGCVELIDRVPTGKTFQVYLNPEKEMSADAEQITGITNDFLKDKPLFKDIADEFLAFVGTSNLVIHNAPFDIGFLNNELSMIGKPLFDINKTVDTLIIAKQKFPGAAVNLDALCNRFNIDKSSRNKHGALIDSLLLAEVYINLLGGRQEGLYFDADESYSHSLQEDKGIRKKQHNNNRKIRHWQISQNESDMHQELLEQLSNAIWLKKS